MNRNVLLELDIPSCIVWYDKSGHGTKDNLIRITDDLTINRRKKKNHNKEYVQLLRGDRFELNRETVFR
jgi:hypothetical protein